MATKSFLKSVTIKNKKDCLALINALENAKEMSKTEVQFQRQVKEVTEEDVRKMFLK